MAMAPHHASFTGTQIGKISRSTYLETGGTSHPRPRGVRPFHRSRRQIPSTSPTNREIPTDPIANQDQLNFNTKLNRECKNDWNSLFAVTDSVLHQVLIISMPIHNNCDSALVSNRNTTPLTISHPNHQPHKSHH